MDEMEKAINSLTDIAADLEDRTEELEERRDLGV